MQNDAKNDPGAASVFPLALMVAGRPCLVVGAGKAGARKAGALIEAGAQVTIVAPEAPADIRLKATEGQLTWHPRPFETEDAKGFFLVFAATNTPAVNRHILDSCRQAGILCGIVDQGWRQGDFISPAILRHEDGLTVAVSTGGASCRRSRMIRDSIGRHVEAVRGALPTVIGTSHACLSLEKRERLSLTPEKLQTAAALLRQLWGVHEFALVNTCNRTELHAIMSDAPETEQLIRRILNFDSLDENESYASRGLEAFQHTALLLAGLHSQAVGESPIVAQVKSSYEDALSAGWSGPMLEEWHDSALHVAKAIRATFRTPAPELEDRCLDELEAASAPLDRGILVIGSGALGRRLLDRFLARYPASPAAWVYHSRRPAVPQQDQARVSVHAFDQLDSLIPRAGVILCAASAPEPVLASRHAALFKAGSPVHVVDLGVPRNVAPDLPAAAAGLRLTGLDDFKKRDSDSASRRADHLPASTRIVLEHRALYEKLMRGIRHTP